jgi:hypothetical protein
MHDAVKNTQTRVGAITQQQITLIKAPRLFKFNNFFTRKKATPGFRKKSMHYSHVSRNVNNP